MCLEHIEPREESGWVCSQILEPLKVVAFYLESDGKPSKATGSFGAMCKVLD